MDWRAILSQFHYWHGRLAGQAPTQPTGRPQAGATHLITRERYYSLGLAAGQCGANYFQLIWFYAAVERITRHESSRLY